MTNTAALLDALRRLLVAAPESLECQDFHHPKADQHHDLVCGPKDRYESALSNARHAIAQYAASPEGAAPVAWPDELALNVKHPRCHEAADAFWKHWNENGETHKHGYYESTWGAINAAIRLVGVTPHRYTNPAPAPVAAGEVEEALAWADGIVRMGCGLPPEQHVMNLAAEVRRLRECERYAERYRWLREEKGDERG